MTDFTNIALAARIADQLPVGIWVARVPGGEEVYANETFAEILGTGLLETTAGQYAQPYGIFGRDGTLYPEDRMPFVLAVQARETVTVDDLVIHRPDGRQVAVRAQARPLFDDAGVMTHVAIAFIDITREMVAEQSRNQAEAGLQHAQRLESIGKLAGGIAHDFNNMLASIKMLASLLRSGELDAERRGELDKIIEVADSGVHLTRSLLGFARRGKHVVGPVALHGVVRTIADLARRTFDKRIEVVTELLADDDVVEGDASQLQQVVFNLAINARDALPEGGKLTLRSRNERVLESTQPTLAGRQCLVFEVEDNGVGVPLAVRERIFEPYFTTKTAGPTPGTGLGLATVYGIVESHGGTVRLVETGAKGALFRVVLPTTNSQVPAVVAHEKTEGSPQPRPGTVLIVDDEDVLRRVCQRALHTLGYRTLTAADGVEAIEQFRQHGHDIDVVLLDVMMPRMGGRETLLALLELRPDVKILIITGFSHNQEVQELLRWGARGYLVKPFDIETLRAAVAGLQ
jgi:two-component system cell cycle sensor histidine kinase/response regulator CckA